MSSFPPKRIEVLVVDEDPVTRTEFGNAVRRDHGLQLVDALASPQEAIEYLARHAPSVLIVGLGLSFAHGLDVIRFAADQWPECAISVISMFGDESDVLAGVEAGATGFILKDGTHAEIAEHIHALHAGCSPISPLIAHALLRRSEPDDDATVPAVRLRLPDGHRQALRDIARGYSYADLAARTNSTEAAIARRINEIYRMSRTGRQ